MKYIVGIPLLFNLFFFSNPPKKCNSFEKINCHYSNSIITKSNDKKITVYVFLSVDCPLSQKYTRTLNQIDSVYHPRVLLYGVFPSHKMQLELKELNKFKNHYNIRFPLIIDKKNKLTKKLKATVTPEAFVLDNENNIIYHGAIDDWAVSIGTTRVKPVQNYLENVLNAVTNHQAPQLSYIKPVGCYIEY